MPRYDYACTACDHRFEIVQAFTDDSLTVCPECEGRLRKVFNAVGVVFKGSGFYRNDSRSPSGPGQTGHGSTAHDNDNDTGSTSHDKQDSVGTPDASTNGSGKGSGNGSDQGSGKGSGNGSDQGSGKGSGKGSDQGSDKGSDQGSGSGKGSKGSGKGSAQAGAGSPGASSAGSRSTTPASAA